MWHLAHVLTATCGTFTYSLKKSNYFIIVYFQMLFTQQSLIFYRNPTECILQVTLVTLLSKMALLHNRSWVLSCE